MEHAWEGIGGSDSGKFLKFEMIWDMRWFKFGFFVATHDVECFFFPFYVAIQFTPSLPLMCRQHNRNLLSYHWGSIWCSAWVGIQPWVAVSMTGVKDFFGRFWKWVCQRVYVCLPSQWKNNLPQFTVHDSRYKNRPSNFNALTSLELPKDFLQFCTVMVHQQGTWCQTWRRDS